MLLNTINNTGIHFIKEAITFISPKHDWLIYIYFFYMFIMSYIDYTCRKYLQSLILLIVRCILHY